MSGKSVAPSITGGLNIVRGYLSKAANLPGQTVSGTAAPGATIEITDRGQPIGTAVADAKGVWSFKLGVVAQGGHLLMATAIDPVTHVKVAGAPVRFMFDVVAPAAPTDLSDAAIQDGVINSIRDTPQTNILVGRSEPGATITVYDSGHELGAAKASSDGHWRFNLGRLPDGTHDITTTATDGGGNLGPASAAIHFTALTALPVTAVDDLSALGGGLQRLTGTSEPGATISIIDNGAVISKVTAAADGSWSFTGTFAPGKHLLSEKVWDAVGNSYTTGFTEFSSAGGTTLMGSVRDDMLIGSPGDTLIGSEGADRFVFHAGFGQETVKDFRASGVAPTRHDVIQFDQAQFTDFADVLAHASQHAHDVWITLDASDVVVLKGVLLAYLHPADFLFV